MKKILVVLLAGLVFVLNGCATIIGHTGGKPKACNTSAMDDVDFVGSLSDKVKVEGYKAIAQKKLTQEERAYLVEAVKKDSLDQKQKDEILLILLNNPKVRSGIEVKSDKPQCQAQ